MYLRVLIAVRFLLRVSSDRDILYRVPIRGRIYLTTVHERVEEAVIGRIIGEQSEKRQREGCP